MNKNPLIEPVLDKNAVEYLLRKKNLPTGLKAAEIAALWDDEAKAKAFFSARVAKADLLEGIRTRVQQVLEGKGGVGDARFWIKEFLKTDGASALSELGFAPVDQANNNDVLSELASTRRINLIVEQNVRMSQAVGEYRAQVENSDNFPYVQYHTREDGKVRASHAALDGKIFRVGSEAHARATPPLGFRCRCYLRELDETELEGRKPIGELPADYYQAKSKEKDVFSFDPRKGMLEPIPMKEEWGDGIKEIYNQDSSGWMKSEISFLEERKLAWGGELAKAKSPSSLKEAKDTIERIDERISKMQVSLIKIGSDIKTETEAGKKYLSEKPQVETKMKYAAEWHHKFIDKYEKGEGRHNNQEDKNRLKTLARAVLSLKFANAGVYEDIAESGFVQHVYVHGLNDGACVIVYVGVHQDGKYIRSVIYKDKFTEKIKRKYTSGKRLDL